MKEAKQTLFIMQFIKALTRLSTNFAMSRTFEIAVFSICPRYLCALKASMPLCKKALYSAML